MSIVLGATNRPRSQANEASVNVACELDAKWRTPSQTTVSTSVATLPAPPCSSQRRLLCAPARPPEALRTRSRERRTRGDGGRGGGRVEEQPRHARRPGHQGGAQAGVRRHRQAVDLHTRPP